MKYKYPRIKKIYPVYRMTKNNFRIGAQRGITKEFTDPTNQLWTLAHLLDGKHSITEVLSAERAAFPKVEMTDNYILDGINLLDSEGFLEEAEISEKEIIRERYYPNVRYFSKFVGVDKNKNRFTPQRKLNNSTVLLLGFGGGGTNILTLLAGLGLKKIKVVDYDVVEEKNLGRQFLYRESDLGKLKTCVARKSIFELNSNVEIEDINLKIKNEDDIIPLLEDVDLVISAIDEPQFYITRIVNKAIVIGNVPCVFGGTQVTRGRVFSVIPGITGCFDCLNIFYSLTDPDFVTQFTEIGKDIKKIESIAYGPAIFQLVSAITDEAVRILTRYSKPRSLATQFEVDYETGSSTSLPSWPRYPDKCPTCGNGREDDWEIFEKYNMYK